MFRFFINFIKLRFIILARDFVLMMTIHVWLVLFWFTTIWRCFLYQVLSSILWVISFPSVHLVMLMEMMMMLKTLLGEAIINISSSFYTSLSYIVLFLSIISENPLTFTVLMMLRQWSTIIIKTLLTLTIGKLSKVRRTMSHSKFVLIRHPCKCILQAFLASVDCFICHCSSISWGVFVLHVWIEVVCAFKFYGVRLDHGFFF